LISESLGFFRLEKLFFSVLCFDSFPCLLLLSDPIVLLDLFFLSSEGSLLCLLLGYSGIKFSSSLAKGFGSLILLTLLSLVLLLDLLLNFQVLGGDFFLFQLLLLSEAFGISLFLFELVLMGNSLIVNCFLFSFS